MAVEQLGIEAEIGMSGLKQRRLEGGKLPFCVLSQALEVHFSI